MHISFQNHVFSPSCPSFFRLLMVDKLIKFQKNALKDSSPVYPSSYQATPLAMEAIPLPLHFPLCPFGKAPQEKEKKHSLKKHFRTVWIKNLATGKREKAYIYLIKFSNKDFCFEMSTIDDQLIGQMQLKAFPNFLWVDYLRNYCKDLENSEVIHRAFSYKEVGKHFIHILVEYYRRGLSFIALKQGFSSKEFYKKFRFTTQAPRGAYGLLKNHFPLYDLHNLYFFY